MSASARIEMIRVMIAVSAALIWTALAVVPASAADKVVLMLNWYVYGEHAPFYYGKAKGLYVAENIDSRNPGRPRLGRDHTGGGRQDRRFRLCRRADHDARGGEGRAGGRNRRLAADQPDVGDGLCREEHQEARGHQGQDGRDHARGFHDP